MCEASHVTWPGRKGRARCSLYQLQRNRKTEGERKKKGRKKDGQKERKRERERERERKKLETSGLILPVTANNVLANFQTSNCLKT